MVNNLNDANEEIRRLRLLLGTKIDGGFEEEDEDKLREELATKYNVDVTTIHKVINGKTWNHIK